MPSTSLSQEKLRAVVLAVDLGLVLQEELPSLADEFRQGLSVCTLIDRHIIPIRYDCAQAIAERAVLYAICGHKRGFNREPYRGLLPPEEIQVLRERRLRQQGENLTRLMCEEKRTIYALSSADHRTFGTRGGKATVLLRGQTL